MREKKTIQIVNYSGATLIILAVVLVVMTQSETFMNFKSKLLPNHDSGVSFEIEELSNIEQVYLSFRQKMIDVESKVARYGNNGYKVLVIVFLFLLKGFLPLVPISATCLLSGAILPFPLALTVNIIGLCGLMAIKYWLGRKLGGGNIEKILKRYPEILALLERDGSGNPWLLFIFRLVPSFPLNPISQLYGSMGYKFNNYMIISIFGFMLKIVSFTVIGSNVYDPLSSAFIVPIIIILFVSGVSMLLVNLIISITNKTKNEQTNQKALAEGIEFKKAENIEQNKNVKIVKQKAKNRTKKQKHISKKEEQE